MIVATRTPAPLVLIDRQLGHLARLLAVVGSVAIVVLMGVTVVAVFWRYALHAPIFGIEDISSMALTVVVAGGIAWGARQGSHISVNVLSFFGGRRLTRITDLITRALGVVIVITASRALYLSGACGKPCGGMTNNLGIVHTPFYNLLSLAMAFYAALLLVQLIIGLFHWQGEDPHESAD